MKDYKEVVQSWLEGNFDAETKAEIKKLQETDPVGLEDAFYRNLEFGTGGLRGIMGVGTNRMITRGEAKPVTCAADILSEFTDDAGDDALNAAAKKVTFTSLGETGQEIYMALLQGEKDADELLDWISCSAQDLNAALTRMLFSEVIKQLPGRIYALDTIHTVVTFDQ